MYCNYESTSISKIIWRKDQKPIHIENSDVKGKYSIFDESKGQNKNTSILVINGVNKDDLGDYECIVKNNIGSENITIYLTYDPEPPHLDRLEIERSTVIMHWIVRSLQPLTEVKLNYQQKDVRINFEIFFFECDFFLINFTFQSRNWLTEKPISQEQSKEHSGIWK